MTENVEDPFLRSLRNLRELLKPDANARAKSVRPSQVRAAQQQQLNDSRSQQHEMADVSTQEYHQQEEELRLEELQTKLREVDTAFRKERALRRSMERAFEDLTAHRKILTEELEKSTSLNTSLQDGIALLRKEKVEERKSFEEKMKTHLEEMDNLHQQKQSALSQRDSMEARMLGSEKLAKELQEELDNVKKRLKEQEGHHSEASLSLKKSNEKLRIALEKSQAKIQTLTNEVCVLTLWLRSTFS